MKNNKGITLIALVITIIVLLILAGVTIVTLTGDNGLLQKSTDAQNKNLEAEIEEEVMLAWNKAYIDSNMDNSLDIKDVLADELGIERSAVTLSENGKELSVTYRGRIVKIDLSTGKTLEIKVAGVDNATGDNISGGEDDLPIITSGQRAPTNSNAQYKSGNYTAIIPAGFTVSNVTGETSIESGLVI